MFSIVQYTRTYLSKRIVFNWKMFKTGTCTTRPGSERRKAGQMLILSKNHTFSYTISILPDWKPQVWQS